MNLDTFSYRVTCVDRVRGSKGLPKIKLRNRAVIYVGSVDPEECRESLLVRVNKRLWNGQKEKTSRNTGQGGD